MRLRCLLALLCLLATVLPTPATAAHAGIRVVEVLPDPVDGREFVELQNTGDVTVDLVGWQLVDSVGNAFVFPTWDLTPGARVVVWGGGVSDASGPAWSKATVWNNGGDVVALHDATGSLADRLAYGSHGTTNPVDHDAEVAAPATGDALVWDGSAWTTGAPTPGQAPGALQGSVTMTVENDAPTATLTGPTWAAPGTTVSLVLAVEDANGPDDVESWQVSAAGAILASGSGAPGEVLVDAPGTPGAWLLQATVVDLAGAQADTSHEIDVRASPLALEMPVGGSLAFPPLLPGATDVAALGSFTLRNDADTPLTPLFDISSLTGPATVSVTDNLDLVWDDGSTVTTIRYDGALTTLPALGAGQSATVQLRIVALPTPLPAGDYGTTFTVVA